MTQTVKVLTNLNDFERIVLAHKNNEGVVHIAHSFSIMDAMDQNIYYSYIKMHYQKVILLKDGIT